MTKHVSTGLILLGLLASCIMPAPLVHAQSPYWDSGSGNSQPYYNPNAGSNNGGSGNTYSQPDYNQPGYNQPNYNQPNNNYNNYGNYGDNNYAQPGYGNYAQPGYGNYGQSGNYGQPGNQYGQPSTQLKGYVSTAPVGTSLSVTNTTYLASHSARIGDPVMVTLGYDLAIGGNIILPSGTQIQGEVVSSIPAGRTGRHGQLQLRFNRAQLPDGRTVPLSARVVTEDGTGIIRGGTSAQRVGNVAKNTLGGAAIGAVSGAALGRIVGGKKRWDEGLLWGSILGAGGGLARSTVQRGDEAELHPGTQLQLMLDQPLTMSNGSQQQYNNYGGGGYPY